MILPEELARIEFLQQLGETYLNRVAGMARLEECLEGTVLFREGQRSPVITFVLSGEVRLEVEEPDGESVEVATVGPGEMLGWSPILGRPMTATARAATRCQLAVFDASRILGLGEADPRFGMAFLRQTSIALSERLRDTRRHLAIARSLGQRSPFTLALKSGN
jgi:CRP-like cAMP-binding protein